MSREKENKGERSGFGAKLIKLLKSEFVSYVIFGGLTTLIYVIVKSLMFKLPIENQSFSIAAATTVAWTAGVLFAFITNKLFVFKSKSFERKVLFYEFLTFFGARLLSYFVDLGLSILFIEVMNMGGTVALTFGGKEHVFENIGSTLVIQVIVVLMNYIFSKLIIFKNKNEMKSNEK